jgi:hypothetical protein
MKTKLMVVVAICLMGSAAFAQESASGKFVVVGQSNPATYKAAFHNPEASRLKFTIFNADGHKVYSEALNVNGFVRTVNFKGMAEGVYSLEITDNTGTYIQKVDYVRAAPASIHVSKIATEENKYLLSVANEDSAEINVRILDGANNLVYTQSLAVNGSVGLVYDLASVQGSPTFEVTDSNGAFRTIKY